VRTGINLNFLTGSDATDPTAVGIWGAFKARSDHACTLARAFPIGVVSAIYLEEYAPRNRWTGHHRSVDHNLARFHRSSSACSALAVAS
jgi:phosphate transport system permease protein